MKKILALIFLAAAFSLHAAAPPRGDERLRELVVFPNLHFDFTLGINCQNNEWMITGPDGDLPDAITQQRGELKRQSENIKQLMRLASLLNENGETNESQTCYQKAGQLCRNKIAANPQAGLSLTTLGAVLNAQGKDDEAESDFRKAVLVSSNEWKCWAGLGNFLGNDALNSLFSKNLRNLVAPGQMPSPAVMDYRPAPEVFKKSESRCQEAARCFERALAIAPKEPEMFIQRAGYMCISNLQNCYIRYYRDHEKISTNEWLLAGLSQATIASLQKAAELDPQNCRLIGFAAYAEWCNVKLQNPGMDFDPNILPSAPRRHILAALTRLENLSAGADKKLAADALLYHGILNMTFGNLPAATADFRRSVTLDPAHAPSWDLLLGVLLSSASPDELLAMAESQLKAKNSALNHIILGKILAQRMDKWDEAGEQAQIAFQMETNSAVPPLLLAAVALKHGRQGGHLADAKVNLDRAYVLLKKSPSDKELPERLRELMLNAAILNLFLNQPESARRLVNQVLQHFPDDPTATELLKNASAN